MTASLIFPTSAFSFVLSHEFSCIISRILSQRASSSGLISSCNSSAVKTMGSSSRWCSSWVSDVVAWSGVLL